MSIQIKISSFFHQYTNKESVMEVQGKTVGECLDQLVKRFPKLKPVVFDKRGKLFGFLDVFVNGESSFPEQLAKPVKDGDTLHLVMLIHGG